MEPSPEKSETFHPGSPADSKNDTLQPKAKYSKWLPLVLLLCFLLIFGIGAAKIIMQLKQPEKSTSTIAQTRITNPTPTPEPISNWKTYINLQYNFKMDYPGRLQYNEDTDPTDPEGFKLIEGVPTVIFSLPYETTGMSNNDDIMVRIFDKTKGSLKDIQESYWPTTSFKNSLKDITIGGYKGQYTEITTGTPTTSGSHFQGFTYRGYVATFEKNDKIYYFHLAQLINDNKYPITDQEFFKSLSTFTFTDQNNNSEVTSAVKNFALANGYKNPVITSDFIKDTQARGTIGDEEVPGSGAKWFAAKINSEWKVVWIGNGLPSCSQIAQYNLPKEFLNCY